ncbi:MAG: lipid-A-disaccharide synthase N-terminal domain-containing protein [Syntrophobacterales bacterium]|nr:MAG: lipid-A-disaccharide synthase N-terminal domain-containing protein [Syntrophobacterales bacterium]
MNPWLIVGFGGQICFSMRFLVQWVASERKGKSVIPIYFWYFSLLGGLTLLTYAIHIKDPVFIVGQSMGAFIYLRNLMLIYKNRKSVVED